MTRVGLFAVIHAILATAALGAADSQEHLEVLVFWGHELPRTAPYHVQFVSEEVAIGNIEPIGLEAGDSLNGGVSKTRAGNADIDGARFILRYAARKIETIGNLHSIWADLIARSEVETVQRLKQDPAYRPDSRKLTVQMGEAGTKGFSVTVDQLLESKAFWIPSLGVYLTAGDAPISFTDHLRGLEAYKGKRVLERLRCQPEATYEQYAARWEDMGSPTYQSPHMIAPGHIVGVTWDSALYKFGIDRGAGVWNDYGSGDHLRFWFDFGDLAKGIQESRKGQRLEEGLPVITTTIEQDGLRYEVEQFAYPLNGPPNERRGDIPMVLLQKVRVTSLRSQNTTASVKMHHRREFNPADAAEMICRKEGSTFVFEESTSQRILFTVAGLDLEIISFTTKQDLKQPDTKTKTGWRQFDTVLAFELNGGASEEVIIKLPSPVVLPEDRDKLFKLDYTGSRQDTLKFWSDYVARGAQFRVPEKVVNDLFRANLWHALRLSRRHGGREESVKIDLPYSNFAYDQHGTPWPVNQAVYVDYMIYGLRGYDDVATEELLTIYRNNQQADGRVAGYANWGVYTPSMIYVAAKNYRLSGDRGQFDRLLPYTLKALDWCLGGIRSAHGSRGPATGLIVSHLNDLTGEGVWAFTQAYVYAALEMLGEALQEIGHPRAKECLEAAASFRKSVERAFAAAAVRSPLVQLRDHTWTPYVQCEVTKSGRLFEQWYPTDVDTGATHLLRLGALPADGALGDYLLNDHEDNLYLHGWGMANEPVYNPQATAYLLRDEPEAVIREFYSYMASAFSHSALEPVEHRWGWGQYFGPPSTDGAWFELYRHMLIHELGDDTLLLLQATPRKWLEDGKRIEVKSAPTYYGELSMSLESEAASGWLIVQIEMPDRRNPRQLVLRFRHPQGKPMQSVTVNGREWDNFNAQKEWVVLPRPDRERYIITAHYWPEGITLGQDNDSHNCTIEVFDANGEACPLAPLGKEVTGGRGIDLLLYNWAALEPGEFHTWIDMTRYFQLTPDKYAASVTVDLNRDGHPAKVAVEDMEFEIGPGCSALYKGSASLVNAGRPALALNNE